MTLLQTQTLWEPATVETRQKTKEQFPSLANQGAIAFDLETNDPELRKRGPGAHRDGYIAGISIGTEAGFRGYYPIAHENDESNLPKEKVFPWLHQQLILPVPKIGARLLYDLIFLDAAGVKSCGPYWDIQVAEPLIDENRRVYNLDSLARKYLKTGKREEVLIAWIQQVLGVKRHHKEHIWRVPAKIVAPYAIGDVDLPLRIFRKQAAELQKLDLWGLFLMESKLIPMLVAMHRRGVPVDVDVAEQLYRSMSEQQNTLMAQIKHETGLGISPWNARSIAKVFDQLGSPYGLTEKTGAPSFTKAFLAQHEHPTAKLVHDIRRLDKLKETFVKGFVLEGNYKGRIHCQFNQLRSDEGGTVTGRFSSSQPNLQQIPIRGEEGKPIRTMFVPEQSQRWHKLDYNQVEFRLIINDAFELDRRGLCTCPGAQEVVEEFNTNPEADYHQIIADMTGLDRSAAKTVNFGLAYGEGTARLCHDLGLSREEGEELLRKYHEQAPFMRPLMDHYKDQARNTREVRTLFGRRRRFNRWATRDGRIIASDKQPPNCRLAFTYTALNARIQGSAADIMKTAMVKVWESGVCDVVGAPHITVHDELDLSSPDSEAGHEAVAEIKNIMEHAAVLSVPLKVDAKSGPNWGACE
jgi:DNA polymerase I-like protein with 3'-5' exonuclease and polymerase domains